MTFRAGLGCSDLPFHSYQSRSPHRRRERPAPWPGSSRFRAAFVAFSWLDLKLAFRMLVKYPGSTLIGGLSIAVAVAIGVGFFALFHSRFYPDDPAERRRPLVGLQNWDLRTQPRGAARRCTTSSSGARRCSRSRT